MSDILFCSGHCSVASFNFPSLPRNFLIHFFPGNLCANSSSDLNASCPCFCLSVTWLSSFILQNEAEQQQSSRFYPAAPSGATQPSGTPKYAIFKPKIMLWSIYSSQKRHWDQHKLYFIYATGTKWNLVLRDCALQRFRPGNGNTLIIFPA